MKIAFLCYSFVPRIGGAQIFSFNLIKNLIKSGHEVDLFLPHKDSILFNKSFPNSFISAKSILKYENKLATTLPIVLRKKIKYLQRLNKYDIWQVVGAYPAGWIVKDLSDIVPVILRSHGDDIQKDSSLNYGSSLNPKIDRKIFQVLHNVTHLVALTKTVEKCYTDFDVKKTKITEIHNGVEIQHFSRLVDSAKERKKLGIKKNQVFILSVGRYHKKKGYELLPEALSYLLKEGFDIKWVIVGKNVKKLKEKFKERGLIDNIVLIEEVGSISETLSDLKFPSEHIVSLYKSADIFVMPSLLETFGMVLIEAMASRLPVVTTNAPGCRDVVQNGKNGLVVPISDSVAIAKAIKKILKNEELKSRLISSGYKFARDHDWIKITDHYLTLYKNILNSNRKGLQ